MPLDDSDNAARYLLDRLGTRSRFVPQRRRVEVAAGRETHVSSERVPPVSAQHPVARQRARGGLVAA